ncbi:DgyrCDS732 [Dimorphilus gyrociliatus]|uniref:mitogen-activated protein kinase kinase n=1 Tax=Dimorphilus gyrociliatus TaxID=2664684 RepID=A0A7I8V7B3_9ANNE|nr:DgyrCDS732 [Dimorphilus gyrociliatus]
MENQKMKKRKQFTLQKLDPVNDRVTTTPSPEHLDAIMRNLGSEARIHVDNEEIVLHADNLQTIQNLGRGAYGHVDLVRDRQSGKSFAVKRMTLASFEEGQRRTLMEVYVAAQSKDCPYTVNFYGAMSLEGELWMIMERMDMSLDKLRENIFGADENYKIPENIIGNITYQIIKGLSYLRDEVSVLHRDVKPSNILINKCGRVKVCDFGISGNIVKESLAFSNVGSKPYLAPEKISPRDGQVGFSSRADVWSLGITVLEFTTGKFPYRGWQNAFEALNDVVTKPSPTLPAGEYSDEFNDFINSTLKKDVNERPRYADLLKKPFIEKCQSVDISSFVQEFANE